VARELRVVLRRAVGWQLRVPPRLGPPPDGRGRPVVEVQPDDATTRRLSNNGGSQKCKGHKVVVSHGGDVQGQQALVPCNMAPLLNREEDDRMEQGQVKVSSAPLCFFRQRYKVRVHMSFFHWLLCTYHLF
jgi:hypothetical protein